MWVDTKNGNGAIITGYGAIPDWVLNDDGVIKHYFWKYLTFDEIKQRTKENTLPNHIALICLYRKSLHSTQEERHDFFAWLNNEYRTRIGGSVFVQANGDKLVIVQRIRKYEKKYLSDIINEIYTIAKTEKFLQHCFDAYWVADSVEGEDLYEILSFDNDSGEGIEDNSRAQNAWLRDHGYKTRVEMADYIGEDEKKALEAQYEKEYREFWKKFPVYNNDCRQCLIHQKLKEGRELAKFYYEIYLSPETPSKNKRKKHRRHR